MSNMILPPPSRPKKSPIENALELTPLDDIGPDVFTHARRLWHPPGARGVYGGAVIAHCLNAAQRTVPDEFTVHSMHCYFVLAGNPDIPIVYHVEHIRQGRSFATRTVQARQRGKPIFTTTLSFVKENSAGREMLQHSLEMPDVPPPVEGGDDARIAERVESPMQSQIIGISNNDSQKPHDKKVRHWVKVRGRISEEGGYREHLTALAYISDSLFIGTVARVHKAWRPPLHPPKDRNQHDKHLKGQLGKIDHSDESTRPEIGMMVSLDHTIYFHNPKEFRADDWLLTEMKSPWSGDGRGLVFQRIYTQTGVLIATCVQEGLVRLRQKPESKI